MIEITFLGHAIHSCGIQDGEQILYGGEAAGYVLHLPHQRSIYLAGDTAVFSDMQLIAQLYQPDLASLPIGDFYTLGPQEAALACRLLNVKQVVPMHFGTFPALMHVSSDGPRQEAAMAVESAQCGCRPDRSRCR